MELYFSDSPSDDDDDDSTRTKHADLSILLPESQRQAPIAKIPLPYTIVKKRSFRECFGMRTSRLMEEKKEEHKLLLCRWEERIITFLENGFEQQESRNEALGSIKQVPKIGPHEFAQHYHNYLKTTVDQWLDNVDIVQLGEDICLIAAAACGACRVDEDLILKDGMQLHPLIANRHLEVRLVEMEKRAEVERKRAEEEHKKSEEAERALHEIVQRKRKQDERLSRLDIIRLEQDKEMRKNREEREALAEAHSRDITEAFSSSLATMLQIMNINSEQEQNLFADYDKEFRQRNGPRKLVSSPPRSPPCGRTDANEYEQEWEANEDAMDTSMEDEDPGAATPFHREEDEYDDMWTEPVHERVDGVYNPLSLRPTQDMDQWTYADLFYKLDIRAVRVPDDGTMGFCMAFNKSELARQQAIHEGQAITVIESSKRPTIGILKKKKFTELPLPTDSLNVLGVIELYLDPLSIEDRLVAARSIERDSHKKHRVHWSSNNAARYYMPLSGFSTESRTTFDYADDGTTLFYDVPWEQYTDNERRKVKLQDYKYNGPPTVETLPNRAYKWTCYDVYNRSAQKRQHWQYFDRPLTMNTADILWIIYSDSGCKIVHRPQKCRWNEEILNNNKISVYSNPMVTLFDDLFGFRSFGRKLEPECYRTRQTIDFGPINDRATGGMSTLLVADSILDRMNKCRLAEVAVCVIRSDQLMDKFMGELQAVSKFVSAELKTIVWCTGVDDVVLSQMDPEEALIRTVRNINRLISVLDLNAWKIIPLGKAPQLIICNMPTSVPSSKVVLEEDRRLRIYNQLLSTYVRELRCYNTQLRVSLYDWEDDLTKHCRDNKGLRGEEWIHVFVDNLVQKEVAALRRRRHRKYAPKRDGSGLGFIHGDIDPFYHDAVADRMAYRDGKIPEPFTVEDERKSVRCFEISAQKEREKIEKEKQEQAEQEQAGQTERERIQRLVEDDTENPY